MSGPSNLVATDHDEYQALVDYCVAQVVSTGQRISERPLTTSINYQGRGTQSSRRHSQQIGQLVTSMDVFVSTVAPSPYQRGFVWLDMNPASNTYRTFCVSVNDHPNAELWIPLTNANAVLRPGVGLAQGDAIALYGGLNNPSSGGGGGDINLTFVQLTPSDTWNITHNLGKFPSVTVLDSAGDEIEGDVHHFNVFSLRITFGSGFSGVASLN